jgi:serine/threonine protein kinase
LLGQDLGVGLELGHYRILDKFGSMAVVYKAEDAEFSRAMALKFIHPHPARDPQALDRFRRESRVSFTLNHRNICAVHVIGREDGRDYLVLKFLEGQSLKHLIVKSPLPPSNLSGM